MELLIDREIRPRAALVANPARLLRKLALQHALSTPLLLRVVFFGEMHSGLLFVAARAALVLPQELLAVFG